MKPTSMTTQMKALNETEYFLMVVFTLLLNRVHILANFMFNFEQRIMAVKEVSEILPNTDLQYRVSCTLVLVEFGSDMDDTPPGLLLA